MSRRIDTISGVGTLSSDELEGAPVSYRIDVYRRSSGILSVSGHIRLSEPKFIQPGEFKLEAEGTTMQVLITKTSYPGTETMPMHVNDLGDLASRYSG